MHIPAYQIHNVLNTFSLQLFKNGTVARNAHSGAGLSDSRLSPQTSRMALIDKVAAEIVHRITRLDTLTDRHIEPSPVTTGRTESLVTKVRNNQFEFKSLDIQNIKTSRSLSIEDSIFFIKKDRH